MNITEIAEMIGEHCADVISFLGKDPLELRHKTCSGALELVHADTIPWSLCWKDSAPDLVAPPRAACLLAINAGCTGKLLNLEYALGNLLCVC